MINKLESEVKERLWQQKPERYFSDVLKISDEHGHIVPLDLNPHQLIVHKEIERQRKMGIPVRIIVLKPRKTGMSTLGNAEVYCAVRFHPADAAVVANNYETSEYLFSITQRFYDESPEREKIELEASSRREMKFARRHDGKQGGRILVATAGRETVGRGFTPLYVLASEVPYYPDADTIMTALLNSVPNTPESMVIAEGTANGQGGWFYNFWVKAKQHQNEFVPIFLNWKDFPKYSMTVSDKPHFVASLSSYERQIQAKYLLTLEQLRWRRWCIANNCGGNEELFKQEYPLDDIEAFLSSGRGRYDRKNILAIRTTEPLRGYLAEVEDGGIKRIVLQPNNDGWLSIWKRPQAGRKYVIGADVAEGIEIEGAPANDKYDWSIADVLDQHTGEQVAQFRSQIEADAYGEQLDLLGRWYNIAFQGIERNNNGETVLISLEHRGYPASAIFSRTHSPDGSRYNPPQKGWKTTQITRANLVNTLDRCLRDGSVIINSEQTVRELLSFVIKANGRPEAKEGEKDDAVFSLGIAMMMIPAAPENRVEPQIEASPLHVTRYKHFNPRYV